MKTLQNSVRIMSVIAFVLALCGPVAAADTSAADYRQAVREANATYKADLLQCDALNGDERISCRREAGAVRNEARAAAKARRAGTATINHPSNTSRPHNAKPGTDAGTIQNKGGMDPKLQRDSPPDIQAPMKK